MCRLLGHSRRDLEQRTIVDITHVDDQAADREIVRRVLAGDLDRYQVEKRYVHADGRLIWVSLHTSVVRDTSGAALYGISQFEDIGARRAEHQELSRRARHDPLTGLLNRSEIAGQVAAAIAAARETGAPGALLFCDLDAFKPVNDTHGHAVGDQVLAIIARRLESQLRSLDTVARFGGDEFVVIANDLSGDRLDEMVARLRDAVAAPIDVAGLHLRLTITIGTAEITGADDECADGLVTAADLDMYLRKPGTTSQPGNHAQH